MTAPDRPASALLHEAAGAAGALGLALEVALIQAERAEPEAVRMALRDAPAQLDRLRRALSELRRLVAAPGQGRDAAGHEPGA